MRIFTRSLKNIQFNLVFFFATCVAVILTQPVFKQLSAEPFHIHLKAVHSQGVAVQSNELLETPKLLYFVGSGKFGSKYEVRRQNNDFVCQATANEQNSWQCDGLGISDWEVFVLHECSYNSKSDIISHREWALDQLVEEK